MNVGCFFNLLKPQFIHLFKKKLRQEKQGHLSTFHIICHMQGYYFFPHLLFQFTDKETNSELNNLPRIYNINSCIIASFGGNKNNLCENI